MTGTLSWKVMYADERFSWFWPPAFDPEQEPLHVESVVALLGTQPGARLLDLACGRGWITVPLAQRGFMVTGCDLSQAMLARAQPAAAQAGVSVAWQRADMRHLPAAWTGRFDYVTHTLSEFECFAEEAENQRVLKPGGRYLLDVVVNRDGWLVRGWSSGFLEGAGLRLVAAYGSLTGAELTRESTGIMLIAEK